MQNANRNSYTIICQPVPPGILNINIIIVRRHNSRTIHENDYYNTINHWPSILLLNFITNPTKLKPNDLFSSRNALIPAQHIPAQT